LWNFDDPANPGKDFSAAAHHGQLVGNPKVVAESRPGPSEPPERPITIVDEPLANLVPVEQRVTHMLRLDGDNGAMIVDALQGFGAGNQAHTVEARIRPHGAPSVRSWPLVLGTPGPGSGVHHWLLAQTERPKWDGTPEGRSALRCRSALDSPRHDLGSTNGVYTVYLNGQTVGKTPAHSLPFDFKNVPLWIGRHELAFPDDSNFKGDIAELRIWNRARSREEIREDLSHSPCSTLGRSDALSLRRSRRPLELFRCGQPGKRLLHQPQ